ncbi:hypothetical protein [Rhizobium sp. CSW-27]|uniref:hypothetical protein n=1 Tax=Rhizobium sp. CSW-27 TaxID=2839985 RepID=UPI0020788CAB|nr:hypothetical protein [Rhizobium sp. CSW-27]
MTNRAPLMRQASRPKQASVEDGGMSGKVRRPSLLPALFYILPEFEPASAAAFDLIDGNAERLIGKHG